MRRLLLLTLAVATAAHADSLDDVLTRVDTSAKAFKSYSADVRMVDYTKNIDLTDTKNGSMRLRKARNGVSGIVDFSSGPDPFILHLDGPMSER